VSENNRDRDIALRSWVRVFGQQPKMHQSRGPKRQASNQWTQANFTICVELQSNMPQVLGNYPIRKHTAILCRSMYAALESIEVRKVMHGSSSRRHSPENFIKMCIFTKYQIDSGFDELTRSHNNVGNLVEGKSIFRSANILSIISKMVFV